MPPVSPGVMHYAVASNAVLHGDPAVEGGFAGIAIKQQEQSWTLGIADRSLVQEGEDFAILHKGQVQIRAALISSPAVGDTLFIATADYTLSKTSGGGKLKLGKIVTLAGDNRGTPTGFVVVDLDARDSF